MDLCTEFSENLIRQITYAFFTSSQNDSDIVQYGYGISSGS